MADLAGLPATVGDALSVVRARLAAAGVPDAAVDARVLAQSAFGGDRALLLTRRTTAPPPDAWADLLAMSDRRARGEPVSRILGLREFWSLPFRITRDTLDPRPDTETVISVVLDRLGARQDPLTLVDLGTGTGCILLALLSELPEARGIGIDRSAGAASVARDNARALGLSGRSRFMVGDWVTAVSADSVDIVVSNPPYIPSGTIDGLQREVARYDPRAALDGGTDGLRAYRDLVPGAAKVLRPGGLAVFEVGADQADPVERLMKGAGFNNLQKRLDFSGIPRCVSGQKTVGLPED